MKFTLNPFEWFKKKEKLEYPSDFAVIVLTDDAKNNGIEDDFNKIIIRYKKGVPQEPIDYTIEEARALAEIEGIPIIDEDMMGKFDFDNESNFGEITTRR